MKRPRLNSNLHEHVVAIFMTRSSKFCELNSIVGTSTVNWIEFVFVCHVTVKSIAFSSRFLLCFRLVLDHRCRYATYSTRGETKAEKQSRKLLINWIQFSWRCRRLSLGWEWEIHNLMRFCLSSPSRQQWRTFFSVRHLMQKTLKERQNFHHKRTREKKAFHVPRNLFSIKNPFAHEIILLFNFHLISLL